MGLPSPTVVEVSEHPDHRQIATFFLGWAFVTSLQCLLSSGVHSDVRRRFCGTRALNTDSEKASAYETMSNITIRSVHPSFMFVLSLCFMFASIAYFASLLSFDSGGVTVCAFVVAWGGLSAQFGRLVALSIILVALRQLGIGRFETSIYVGWLVAGLGIVFANYAIGTGSISEYDKLNIYLCHREHNLGLSLASSFMYSLIEVYAIGRILSLTYSQSQHALVWLGDFRVRRAFSLLVLELLTMVPSALFTGVLGEFLPFSIGAVIVLLTFQQEHQQIAPVVPVAQRPSDAAALRDFYLASNRHVPSLRSHRVTSRPRYSVRQSIPYAQPRTILDHPYSAKSLEDPALEADRWMSGYRTHRSSRRSSRTIDSRSLRSVGEAVVEVVRRARYPWARPSSSEIPALPPMNSTLSLVRPRLVMLEGNHQYAKEDVKPDTPITVQSTIPDPALDPLKSHFSVSSKSGSAYRTSESVSLPPSPYTSYRSGSLTSFKVTSDCTDVQLYLPSLPATPPSPVSSSVKSRAVSVSTMSLVGSDRHSIFSDAESTTTGQVVTIMPPPALPTPSLHLRIPSDSRPRQFRAAGYANPIPLPKFPRDMYGSARGPKADVPQSRFLANGCPRFAQTESTVRWVRVGPLASICVLNSPKILALMDKKLCFLRFLRRIWSFPEDAPVTPYPVSRTPVLILKQNALVSQCKALAPSGPWDTFNYAPDSRTVYPTAIYTVNGDVSAPENLIGDGTSGSATLSAYSWIALDFGVEVGGLISLTFETPGMNDASISFAFTESPSFIDPLFSDDSSYPSASMSYDGILQLEVPSQAGYWVQPDATLRGGFRYLTIASHAEEDVAISNVSCAISFMPHVDDLRAYTGYFYASDPVHEDEGFLSKIWYAGAYTVQTNTVPLHTGRQVPFAAAGEWFNNATLGVAGPIIVDGAKRDRAVWPGDMGIAVPAQFVSTFDLIPTRNALATMFAAIDPKTGALPESGPPLSQKGSDTYHAWTLIGTHNYFLYSGDTEWLETVWTNYTLAVAFLEAKVDASGLMNVTGLRDWARLGGGGHNAEGNALLYGVLTTASSLASWLNLSELSTSWAANATALKSAFNKAFWVESAGMYRDNTTTTLMPQDANSFAVLYNLTEQEEWKGRISEGLMDNWNELGAVAPELPDTISPFIGGFELQAHFESGNDARALDLLRREWGYMLYTNLSVQSTLLEGFTANGSLGYRSYRGYNYDAAYTSHAHGWSAGPTSALTFYVLGMTITSPKGKTWALQPHIGGGLPSAEGGFETGEGWFGVKWTLAEGVLRVEIETPETTNGVFRVPQTFTGEEFKVELDAKTVQLNGTEMAVTGGKHVLIVAYS